MWCYFSLKHCWTQGFCKTHFGSHCFNPMKTNKRIFSNSPLSFIGVLSFSLYLYIYIYIRNILIRSNFPHTVTSTCNKKCEKPRCQICNIITTDTVINIPGTSHIYHPGNYNCDSSNIVYLLMCNKCNYGNYVGETSTKFCLQMNNHKKSIRDNHKGLPVAVHYNQADHSINDLSCVILSGNFTTTADRQLYEQKLIQRFDTYKCGLNRDLGFLSKYAFFNRS